MIQDAFLPPGLEPSSTAAAEVRGLAYTAARWSPADLERLTEWLRRDGKAALDAIDDDDLLRAWADTVAAFRDPDSPERRESEPALERCCGLSTEGLAAGLEAVLGGVAEGPARELLSQAEAVETPEPVLVILASNLPALAVQPLLPALLSRRPTILKSPTAEPFFAPAFVRALTRRLTDLGRATAALTWPGGDKALEGPLLAGAGRVLAYGEAETLADLERRAPGKVFGYGPKISIGVIGADADPEATAVGLARDVALFDQRGCLSIHAVFVEDHDGSRAGELASALARDLERLSRRWPPGPLDAVAVAGAQQVRTEARMRGLHLPPLPVAAGTVVVEPRPELRASPGARTVRVHALASLDEMVLGLRTWKDRLQGAALAGNRAWRLRHELEALHVSRFAAPGELQTPDALWHNGGVHPLAVFGTDTRASFTSL